MLAGLFVLLHLSKFFFPVLSWNKGSDGRGRGCFCFQDGSQLQGGAGLSGCRAPATGSPKWLHCRTWADKGLRASLGSMGLRLLWALRTCFQTLLAHFRTGG